jgi:hypothetical protein
MFVVAIRHAVKIDAALAGGRPRPASGRDMGVSITHAGRAPTTDDSTKLP